MGCTVPSRTVGQFLWVVVVPLYFYTVYCKEPASYKNQLKIWRRDGATYNKGKKIVALHAHNH